MSNEEKLEAALRQLDATDVKTQADMAEMKKTLDDKFDDQEKAFNDLRRAQADLTAQLAMLSTTTTDALTRSQNSSAQVVAVVQDLQRTVTMISSQMASMAATTPASPTSRTAARRPIR